MLNRRQILKIRELNNEGFSVGQIGKELKISYKTVDSYLKSEEFSTHPQNLDRVEHASIPNIDDDKEIVDLQMAPQLSRKLATLGMVAEDIFNLNPKTWFRTLNQAERHMLRVFLEKHNAFMTKKVKEAENEAFRVAKQELDRLYDLAIDGRIDLETYDTKTESLLLEMEAEFSR